MAEFQGLTVQTATGVFAWSAVLTSKWLFRSHLSSVQKVTLLKWGFVDLYGSEGGMYRIDARGEVQTNVWQFDRRAVRVICCHLDHLFGYPPCDHFLGQYLWIQSNERAFMEKAAVHGWTTIQPHYEIKPWSL